MGRTYRYIYHGTETIHLPEHGILAKGGDTKIVYESDAEINHPDFEVVKEHSKKQEK
jgi:hypothetical protein